MSSFLFIPVAAGVVTGITSTVIHDCAVKREWCSDQSSDEKVEKGAIEMESRNDNMNGMPTTDAAFLEQNLQSENSETVDYECNDKAKKALFVEKEAEAVDRVSSNLSAGGTNLSPLNSMTEDVNVSERVLEKYETPYWESFALSPKNLGIRDNIAWTSIGTIFEFVLTALLGRAVGALASFLSCYSIEGHGSRLIALLGVKNSGFESFVFTCQILSALLVLLIWMIKEKTFLAFLFAVGHSTLCVVQWFLLGSLNENSTSADIDELHGSHTRVFALMLAAFIVQGVLFMYRRLTTVRKLENTCCVTFSLVLMCLLGGMVAFMWGAHSWSVEVMANTNDPRAELQLYLSIFRSPVSTINMICGIAVCLGMIGMTIGSCVFKKYEWFVLNLSVTVFVLALFGMVSLDRTSPGTMYDCVKDPTSCMTDLEYPTETVKDAIDYYNTIHGPLMVQWLLVKMVVALNLIYFQDFCIAAQALLNVMLTYEGAIILWGVTAIGVGFLMEFDKGAFKTLRSTNQVIHLLGDMLVVSYHVGAIPTVVSRKRMHSVLYGLGFFMTMALMIPGAEGNLTWQKFLLGHIGDTGLSIAEFSVLFITMTTPGMWDSALVSSMGRAVHGFSLLLGRFFLWNTMCGYWALWFGLGTLYAVIVIVQAFFWTEHERQHFASRTHLVTEQHWPKLLLLVALIAFGATLKEYDFAEFVDTCVGFATNLQDALPKIITDHTKCFCFTNPRLTYDNHNLAPASTLTNVAWLTIIMASLVTVGYNYSKAMMKLQKQSWEDYKVHV